jgi:hypothetical protein
MLCGAARQVVTRGLQRLRLNYKTRKDYSLNCPMLQVAFVHLAVLKKWASLSKTRRDRKIRLVSN